MPTIAEFYGRNHWGDRYGATAGRANPHRGMDFNGWSQGILIPALYGGVVVFNGRGTGLGWMVSIRRPDGAIFGYSHLAAQSPLGEGATVQRGQSIGPIGKTGTLQTGVHLHLTKSTSSVRPDEGGVENPTNDVIASIEGQTEAPGPVDPGEPGEPPVVPVDGIFPIPVGGWLDDPAIKASVKFTSRTGRVSIEVGVSGFGEGVSASYSIPGLVSREENYAGTNYYRNAFLPTGQMVSASKKWIREDLPRDREVEIFVEVRNGGSGYAGIMTETLIVQNLIADDVLPDLS